MTTVAHLVASHALPGQVLRLVRTIRTLSPAAPVLDHHDPRGAPLDAAALGGLGEVRLVPAAPVGWGRGSQLELLLRCLRFALRETELDWLTTLSPARPLEAAERDLAATAFDGFVESHEVPPPPWRRDGGDAAVLASGTDFARKFDATADAAVLDELDRPRRPRRPGRRR
ncbi:MAG: hypothetical protein M3P50_09415 [Actinomycetota bacterium]|nr:hypothetical protein [Actinomycetota bacterium]